MSTISKNYRRSNTLRASRFSQSAAAPILLGVLFFFVLCLGAPDSIKGMAMIVAIAALLVTAVRFGVLREHIRWPFVALTLVVIMDGISTFYAVSGKFALKEFLKVFLAYGIAVILLATSPKNEEVTGKRIATILAVCTAIGSLVSIDLISTRWISGVVTWALGLFTDAYDNLSDVAPDRISSLFDNSNVFGGFSGIGLLLSLGLADAAKSRKNRFLYLTLHFINALAFVLAFNRGAYVFAAAALVIFLLLKPRQERIGTFILLLEALVIVAAATLVVAKLSFGGENAHRMIPLLCTILGAAALCGMDCLVSKRIASRLQKSGKTISVIISVIVLLFLAYGIAAFSITSDVTLPAEGRFLRIAFLKPGTYTLSVETDGNPLNVNIGAFSQANLLMYQYPELYNGSADEVEFTVPEDAVVVQFLFQSSEGARLISASCSGHKIPLRYVLLPSFIVNRLQTVSLLHNSLQRLVYFQDGFKLFRRSPIFGLGIGAFENAIKSVQSYYYETKYAHNHYFQTLLETGIIGLILFLGMLVFSAAAIWKSRKKHPYAPMLGAALVFMAGHAMHDIVFSAYAYLPIAYGTVALIDLCCGEAVERPKLTKTVRTVLIAAAAACTIIFCGFLAGNMIAAKKLEETPTMDTLVEGTRLDRFEWADYALPYVISVTGEEDVTTDVLSQADAFAERLAKVNSNTIPIYLAQYYFASNRIKPGIEMVEKYVNYVSSDERAWNTAFGILQNYADDSEVFRNGVARIAQKLETWNAENMGTIRLSEAAQAFIASYAAS